MERLLARRAAAAPALTYRRVEWLLVRSLVTIAGAVAGGMGVNLFDWSLTSNASSSGRNFAVDTFDDLRQSACVSGLNDGSAFG
jgi:hypothetical protein